MKKIIELLEKTDEIYTKKLNDSLEILNKMDVIDEKFDDVLSTTAKLMSLKLQKTQFVEEYKEREENK